MPLPRAGPSAAPTRPPHAVPHAHVPQLPTHLLALALLKLGLQQAPGPAFVQLEQRVLEAAQHWAHV